VFLGTHPDQQSAAKAVAKQLKIPIGKLMKRKAPVEISDCLNLDV
jgi:hypothetical protein